eukprot:282114-Chlamydomonas_euryale.AAC.2
MCIRDSSKGGGGPRQQRPIRRRRARGRRPQRLFLVVATADVAAVIGAPPDSLLWHTRTQRLNSRLERVMAGCFVGELSTTHRPTNRQSTTCSADHPTTHHLPNRPTDDTPPAQPTD